MQRSTQLPDEGQVSVLLAASLLTNTLTRYVNLPPYPLNIRLPGFSLTTQITFDVLVSVLAAALIAAGMHWLIKSHPLARAHSAWTHVWLPALCAYLISILIHEVPPSRLMWWVMLALGALFLLIVIIAEYLSLDSENIYFPPAVIGLTGIAFAAFAALLLLWHANGVRLILLAGFVFALSLLISLRILSLRLSDQPVLWEAAAIALLQMHLVAALHYWPLSSARFAVMCAGALYALISLAANLRLEPQRRRTYLEPASLLILLWGAAVWLS